MRSTRLVRDREIVGGCTRCRDHGRWRPVARCSSPTSSPAVRTSGHRGGQQHTGREPPCRSSSGFPPVACFEGPVPLAEPRIELRAHPGPEDRLSGDACRREGLRFRRSRIRTRSSTSSTSTCTGRYLRTRCRTALHGPALRRGPDSPRGRRRDARHLGPRWSTRRTRPRSSWRGALRRDHRPQDDRTVGREAVLDRSQARRRRSSSTRTHGPRRLGAEIMATIMEEAFEDLDAPVQRITAPDTPVPVARGLGRGRPSGGGRGNGRGLRPRVRDYFPAELGCGRSPSTPRSQRAHRGRRGTECSACSRACSSSSCSALTKMAACRRACAVPRGTTPPRKCSASAAQCWSPARARRRLLS